MSVRILGIGNPLRGDDGAGPAAIRLLEGTLPANIEARVVAADPALLLAEISAARACVVLDAAAPDGNPGRIARIAWSREAPVLSAPGHSTHGFGLAEALALAEALGSLPPETVLWTIEGVSFALGEGLSPPVASALPSLARRARAEAVRLHRAEGLRRPHRI